MKRRFLRLLAVALLGLLGGFAAPSAPALAAPAFKVPFPCGQAWSGQTRTNHSPANAIDFNRTDDAGDPVVASAPGTVDIVKNLGDTSYGRYVRINHGGGYTTYYAHLSGFNVSVGQTVGYLLAPFGVHVDALPVTRAIGMVVLVGVLIWLWFRSLRRGEPFWHAALALTATVALSPLFHPWYWLWPLAVLAATAHRTLWFSIVTVVSSFLVLADGTGLARYSKMPGAPLMTLFVIGVVVWLVRSARKGRQPVPAD